MKTITVKGVGTASKRPDLVVLSFGVITEESEYEAALAKASDAVEELSAALSGAGVGKPKTSSFDVRTEYKSVRDENGNYRQEFSGYSVTYRLKLELGFTMESLRAALRAVSECKAMPEISLTFGLSDPAALDAELLENAALNAKAKAEVLCRAMGKKLGELVSVEYDWKDHQRVSDTKFEGVPLMAKCAGAAIADVDPEDVKASDSASFVWEIV